MPEANVATTTDNFVLVSTTPKVGAGKTIPGATNWRKEGAFVKVTIDTSAAGFTTVPIYTASLAGDSSISMLTGTSSICKPTAKSFEVHVTFEEGSNHSNETELSVALANQNKWHVNWIGIEPGSGNPSQPSTAKTPLPTPGKYYYLTAKVSGKVLDVEASSTSNGGNIYQFTKSGQDNQQWKLEDAGNGYYYLIAKHSGKVAVADYKGVTGKNLNNVVQYDKVGAEEQKWKLEDAGDGYFCLVNKATGKLLDVLGGGKDDRVNVQQCERNGTDAQKWKFEAV